MSPKETICGRFLRVLVALIILAGCLAGQLDSRAAESADFLQEKKVAVTVFAQNEQAKGLTRTAQSRLEEVMADNEVIVLDEQKTQELKDVFKTLEDPGAFVTAELFVENSQRYDLDGLLAIYLSADVIPGLAGFYSATAHVDIRYIDNESARVKSMSTPPMGSRGSPPSEGVTRNSAAINAVRRAVDAACTITGFEVADLTRPRSVDLTLGKPVAWAGGGRAFFPVENDRSLGDMARLEQERWRTETVTATARAPAGDLAALAGYITDTDFHRRPPRLYGSRVHVLDLAARKPVIVFDCSPVEKKSMQQEPRTKQVLACTFVGGWRHLCAATGNHVFLWDIELGLELAKQPMPSEPMGIALVTDELGSSVLVKTASGIWQYRIARKP